MPGWNVHPRARSRHRCRDDRRARAIRAPLRARRGPDVGRRCGRDAVDRGVRSRCEIAYFALLTTAYRTVGPEPRVSGGAGERTGARPRGRSGRRRRPSAGSRASASCWSAAGSCSCAASRATPTRPVSCSRSRSASRSPGYTLVDKEGIEHARVIPYFELVLVPAALVALAWHAARGRLPRVRAEIGWPTVGASVFAFAAYAPRARGADARVGACRRRRARDERPLRRRPRRGRASRAGRTVPSRGCSRGRRWRRPGGPRLVAATRPLRGRASGIVATGMCFRRSRSADKRRCYPSRAPHFTGFTKWARSAHFC